MTKTKVLADDLFFFDNEGDRLPLKKTSDNTANSEEDTLIDDIDNLILNSNSENEFAESICSLDDSYSSDDFSITADSDNDSEIQEEEVPKILPHHACVYCSIYDSACVAKCNKCSKWFCNSPKGTLSGHIINHLIKSGHKEVSLHPESLVGDSTIECYNCGCKNIFLLGFIQAKEDDVIVILCRQPCAFNAPKESDWNVAAWSPLISERRLLPWLCKFPSNSQESRARKVAMDQIQKLEGLWKSGMTMATLEDINRKEQEDILEPTHLSYSDPHEFKSIMIPLITAEAKIEKDLKEAQVLYFIYYTRY